MGKRFWVAVTVGLMLAAGPLGWAAARSKTKHAAPAAPVNKPAAADASSAADGNPGAVAPSRDATGGQTFITYSPKDKDPWDKAGIVCEFLLAAVGMAGVVVGILIVLRMERQGKAAERAAKADLDLRVATERAWLVIGAAEDGADGRFAWTITNVGRTPARLMQSEARCEVVDGERPLADRPEYGAPVYLNDRMLAPGETLRLAGLWEMATEAGYAPVDDVSALRGASLLAYGSVTYLDVFDRERESRFCEEAALEEPLRFRPQVDAPPAYTLHR